MKAPLSPHRWRASLARVAFRASANLRGCPHVSAARTADDTTVHTAHIAKPGLIVLDIAPGDEDPARVTVRQFEQSRRTSGIVPVRHVPGQPGVTARICADPLPR
ncbi:DUF6207 family protein [Streptomyces sp. NBC_01497]|uniref:DUF6207 family protein n=1 Tax=Streptomyces sp. NBC_01497 TaxID=2903885 RepID=UPI002E356F61|nr:DUF6207 family protein [Streptomyces sp. NBC_01497]